MTQYKNALIDSQTRNCLLCNRPQCTKECSAGLSVDRILRSLRFENPAGAARLIPEEVPCIKCTDKACMTSCIRAKIDYPVQISDVIKEVAKLDKSYATRADLSTSICGVKLENPFVLSSSVVGSDYEMVAKAFEMGWAGVAFKTIGMFTPQEVSPRFDQLQKEGESFIGFKNIEQISDHTLQENLNCFKKLKKNYPDKIILASIMGQNEEEWTQLAKLSEEAGADIIECNFSCPHMTGEGLGSDVGTNPELVARYTRATRKGTKLPILAKMTPNITNMEIPALAAVEAGANGIAAINTIKSVMNIDLTTFVSGPQVKGKSSVGGYSGKAVKPIALRFIHDMKKNEQLQDVAISGMGGIETWKDAAEFIAMGCSTIQITTAVMQYGYRIIDDLIDGLSNYMQENHFENISQLLGKALINIIPADDLERDSISYPKFDRKSCVGCGRCYIACFDGGHQALTMNESNEPVLNPQKCVGCHLCAKICPAGAICPGVRVQKKKA